MNIPKLVNGAALHLIRFARRRNPAYRRAFNRIFRKPLFGIAQFLVNVLRRNERLGLAEERTLEDEEAIAAQIVESMSAFLRKHYAGRIALRAGNTKTYGVVRARFEILPDLPESLRAGLFGTSREYPAWVRFAGPGPLATPDIDNNGILSIGVKVMGVPGPKLLDDEKGTQDFTGISAPTFTTPNVRENLKLQQQIYNDTPVWYFLNPFDSHYLDALMQGLYAESHADPLELQYFSCVPYLYGEGRAVKYTFKPRITGKSTMPRPPTDNYLREAMAKRLSSGEVVFDVMVQFQTDPHRMPIENASVVWPEKLSPYRRVAVLRIPRQVFDSPAQLDFARSLSYNPWHCLPEHRPLGNQNRARKRIYCELSRLRQAMNQDRHVEPTGEEVFEQAYA